MLPRKILPKPSTAEAASGSSASPDKKAMVIKILPESAKLVENRMISLDPSGRKPPAPPAIIIKASDVSNTVVDHKVLASRKILNQCGVCDKKFNNSLELNNHMKLEHSMHQIDKKTYQFVPKTPPQVSKREREISEASASPSRSSKRARKLVDYKVLASGDPLELDEEEIHIKEELLNDEEDSDNYQEETQSNHAETDDDEGDGVDDVEDTVSKNRGLHSVPENLKKSNAKKTREKIIIIT